jgi:hypothetical protein
MTDDINDDTPDVDATPDVDDTTGTTDMVDPGEQAEVDAPDA